MNFHQRRRLVLTTFAVMFCIFAVAAVVWRESVARTLIWLFSESFGAVILLTIISMVWVAKAKRHQALNRMRPSGPPIAVRPQFTTPASAVVGRVVVFALVALILIALMRGC